VGRATLPRDPSEHPDRSPSGAKFTHHLGIITHQRGDYEQALGWYRQALAINEKLGDRASLAGSYHQIGNVAFLRGDSEQALNWYRQSLPILRNSATGPAWPSPTASSA